MLDQVAAAAKPESAERIPDQERRVRVRFPASFMTLCQNDAADVGDFWWMGRVQDLSGRGIGLLLSLPFDLDSILVIEPTTITTTASTNFQAKVIRLEDRQADGWFIGCEFLQKLTDDEVRRLLT